MRPSNGSMAATVSVRGGGRGVVGDRVREREIFLYFIFRNIHCYPLLDGGVIASRV
jgi:hypothetical protein